MTASSDRLSAIRRRDPDALRDVAHTHTRRRYRAARGMGLSAEEADDLVQDVFVTFLATLDRFEGRSSVGTWLYGILLRKVQERRRARVKEDRPRAHEPRSAARDRRMPGRSLHAAAGSVPAASGRGTAGGRGR